MRTIVNHFLRGLLFVFPIGATLYIVIALVQWTNTIFNNLLQKWFHLDIPGLGILIAFVLISFIGLLVSTAFIQPVFRFFERGISKMPLVKIIYTSIKDLTEAFVGDKKRFNVPVLMDFNDSGLQRLGFITRDDLQEMGIKDKIAVYCPHSYNFSGNLFIVPPEQVERVDVPSANYMKFIVSGGVTSLSGNNDSDQNSEPIT